jgi:hypothetical protein
MVSVEDRSPDSPPATRAMSRPNLLTTATEGKLWRAKFRFGSRIQLE